MKTTSPRVEATTLAATVAPEDLRSGDFVAVLNQVVEFPSFLWFDASTWEREEPVRVRLMADFAGVPWRVRAICLPLVFVKCPQGRFATIDVRRHQLARLDERYARLVWKQLRKQAQSSGTYGR